MMTKQQTDSIKIVVLVVLVFGMGLFVSKMSTTTKNERKDVTAQVFDQNANKTLVDEISSLNTTILKKRDDIASLRTMLEDRQTKIATLLKDNPSVVPFMMFSDAERKTFPTDVQNLIEQTTSFTGKIYTTVTMDDSGKESYSYRVSNGKGPLMPLYGINTNSPVSGTATINGYTLNGNVIVSPEAGVKLTGGEKSIGTGSASTTKKMLVILTKASGTLDPFTPAQFSQKLFQGNLANFYKEQSYNKLTLAGDVFGWVTTNNPIAEPGNSTIDAYLLANQINIANYDYIFMFYHQPQGFGGFSSIGPMTFVSNGVTYTKPIFHIESNTTGETMTYINSENFGQSGAQLITAATPVTTVTRVEEGAMHELGHSMGLLHAVGYECGTVPLALDCTDIEYGSNFDMMGESRYAFHMNGYFKDLLGWIGTTERQNITATGTYTLNSFETIGGKKVAVIKPLGIANTKYYLEFRTGFGYDNALINTPNLQNNMQGLLVSKVGTNYSTSVNTSYRFLDMQPTMSGIGTWYDDLRASSLNAGGTFTDPRTGVTISQVNAATANATPSINFKVTLTPTTCVPGTPQLVPSGSPLNITTSAGNNVFAFFNLKNTDYPICTGANFTTTYTLPTGFSATPTGGYYDNGIMPEQILSHGLNIYVPATTAPGSYPVVVTTTHAVTNTQSTLTFTITVQ